MVCFVKISNVKIFFKGVVFFIFCSCVATSPRVSTFGKLNSPQLASTNKTIISNLNRADTLSLTRVDNNIWRTNIDAQKSFALISRIFAQTYILSNIDKKQLQLTTEWDKFFVNGRLFRNRVSANIFPISGHSTEVVIKNYVEYYDASIKDNADQNSWIPTSDITDEVSRIITSLTKQASVFAQLPTQ